MEPIQIIKEYKIIKIIGRGGCGIVYLAQKGNKDEYYALKKIPILTKEEKENYEKILNAILKINNEYIIKYYEYFIENDFLYIIMEYGGDSDLKKFIEKYNDKNELISEEIINEIILGICSGLKEIHKNKLIHRDLTPDNIFINENNKIKIGDFSVSRVLTTLKNYTKSQVGKLHYLAPEMVNKENYNYKVDIYALGCIIYELFTLNEYYETKFGNYQEINSDIYNSKWQYLINFLLNSDYNNRPDIEDIYNFIINKTPLNIINEDTLINKIIQIENNVVSNDISLHPDIFDINGDKSNGWTENGKRGGEKYIPPLGWIGIGLKVIDKYENNIWLGKNNIKGEYCVAYYGLNNILNKKEKIIEDLNSYILDIRNLYSESIFNNEDDKRSGFLGFIRKKCGKGVCLFQDPKYAECSAGIIKLNDIEYKMLLMCRVNPTKIRQPTQYDNFWILNPASNEIRPYRILLKRNNNNSLSLDEKIKVSIKPIDYIMNAIYSKDYSFYNLKNDRRFNDLFYNIQYLVVEIFAARVYSSIYYKFLSSYMLNQKIIPSIDHFYNNFLGFSKEQLDSFICCLQNEIRNIKNVENNTIVYMSLPVKFDNSINIGSQFYFPTFVSTSKNRDVSLAFLKNKNKKEGTLIKINIQNNGIDDNHPNYCLYIENISLTRGQEEVVICSHCYFQVTKVNRSNPYDYIDLVCKGYLLDEFYLKDKNKSGSK